MATPGILKITVFSNKRYTIEFMSMTSRTKFYHAIQFTLWMWLCDPNLVTLTFL